MGIFKHSPGCDCCGFCPCEFAGVSDTISLDVIPAATNSYCSDCSGINRSSQLILTWQANEEKDGKDACRYESGVGAWFGGSCHPDNSIVKVWIFTDGDIKFEFDDSFGPSSEFLASDHSYSPTDHDCYEQIDVTIQSDVEISDKGYGGSTVFCKWVNGDVFTLNGP